MIDSFHIGAYWGSRRESLPQVRDKILKTLQKLAEVDEQFLNWYEGGNSRREALTKKISIDAPTIERLSLEMVRKGELDEKGFAEMGFLLGLWSGHLDDESSNISFNVGKGFVSPHLSNACVLTIPFEGPARERLLQIEKAKKVVALLVEIWNPEYAVLASRSLNDKLGIVNDIGWITYRKSIRRHPNITSKVTYEKANNGHWFYVNDNHYNEGLINEILPVKAIL